MNIKSKSKSKICITKPYASKPKKTRKKSPKIIDYDKVAQKYGNLLETSLNTSNSTQHQKLPINNNDDSYYDFIIDNIYEANNIKKESKFDKKAENTKNDDSSYYFTFKSKIPYNNKEKNFHNEINKYKSKAPISIVSNNEEMNKYFKEKNKLNNSNNINNISSIKNYNNMYNTYNKQSKKTKVNKSFNKPKRLNRINSQENNFNYSKKLNTNSMIRNCESIHVQGNESIKEDVIIKNKDKISINNNNININKYKEKVFLLLNLCRKYAYKFNKLINNKENYADLKNSILQFNNMIFNQNLTKILDINKDDVNIDKISSKYFEEENKIFNEKIKIFENEINNMRKKEIQYEENINKLNIKIDKLNQELNIKENIIKDLKIKLDIKSNKIKEFHGIIDNGSDINEININSNNTINDDNNDDNKPLNTEIEKLDQEIFDLKSKLKKIIQK